MNEKQSRLTAGRIILRFIQVFIFAAVLAAIYFISAGNFKMPWGWVFLVIYFVFNFSRVLIAGEGLIEERSKFHKDSKSWDRYLTLVPLITIMGILLVSGLDNGRKHWTPELPLWLHMSGAILLVGVMAVNTWGVQVNRFYSNVVRIQTDRGHQVIDRGPYAILRHPTYAMSLLFYISLPLMLGSYWALAVGFMGCLGAIVRTALEDKTLQAELPGYAEYCKKVRYRLIPGIW